jgi:hypothetical protein
MTLGLVIATSPQVSFAQSNPFLGTWQLNLAKSKHDPGPPPRSLTSNIQAETQGTTVTTTGVNAEGNPISNTITIVFDGMPHPVVGISNADALASTQIDAYTQIYSVTKAGKLVGTLMAVLAPDGKTYTANFAGINANGQKIGYVRVWDKQ